VRTLPTPCARDGKGPGYQYGLPDLVEPGGTRHALLPTPTAVGYGSNRSPSPGATRRPGLHQLAGQLLPTPTAGGGTGYMSGSNRDMWRPTLESAVRGYQATRGGKPAQPGMLLPTPTVADSLSSANATAGRTLPMIGHAGRTLTDAARLLPTPRATDGVKGCPGQRGSHDDLTLPAAAVRVRTLPTPRASDGHGPIVHGQGGADLTTAIAALGQPDQGRWGDYANAVARWETLLGRAVPEPTQPGRHSKPVLAPPFVEWLMGLPDGWVTGPDLAVPRTARSGSSATGSSRSRRPSPCGCCCARTGGRCPHE
jgi:hypothetical protein